MGNLNGFNAAEHTPTSSFDLVADGWYKAIISESSFLATKAGTGNYLKLRFQIIDGPSSGRVLFANLNLDNPNTVAVEIAQADLSSICTAVGKPTPNDSQELHDIPLDIKVSTQAASGGYDASNVIKGYTEAGSKSSNTLGTVETPTDVPDFMSDAPAADANAKPWA